MTLNWGERVKCDCTHPECRGYATPMVDPYREDVMGETHVVTICHGDYYEKCQDI